jgi:hypothetical protein
LLRQYWRLNDFALNLSAIALNKRQCDSDDNQYTGYCSMRQSEEHNKQ